MIVSITFLFISNAHFRFLLGLKPEIVPFAQQISIDRHDFYELNCNSVKGSKPLQFEWFKDGYKIGPEMGFSITSKPAFSRLTFDEFRSDSSGNFSCRISNSDGADESWTILQLKSLSNFLSFLLFFLIFYSNPVRYVALLLPNFLDLKLSF